MKIEIEDTVTVEQLNHGDKFKMTCGEFVKILPLKIDNIIYNCVSMHDMQLEIYSNDTLVPIENLVQYESIFSGLLIGAKFKWGSNIYIKIKPIGDDSNAIELSSGLRYCIQEDIKVLFLKDITLVCKVL